MPDFYRGETIRIDANILNDNSSYVNVNSVTIVIQDPNGDKIVNASPLLNVSIGRYRFFFNTSTNFALGLYKYEIKSSVGPNSNIEQGAFMLISSLE
jgi:hypothetical protein